jgi:hypothetical protein
MLGEAAFGLLREDERLVDEDVELPPAARRRRRGVAVDAVDLGRETRSPCVVAASGRAVEDADRAHRRTYSCSRRHCITIAVMAQAPPQELLANVDLFRDLDKKELREIAIAMKQYTFDAGREIVTQGQNGVGFFVIADGTAAVSIDGGEVRKLGNGDYFGEIALLADAPRTATVTAETDLTCWGLVSWAFRPIVEANGPIAWKLLQAMARIYTKK